MCSINPAKVRTLSALLGMPIVDNLSRYIGVPIIHNRVNKNTYQVMEARVIKKLSSWHAKSLSLVRRLILIQSVLATIPLYIMQTTSIPKATLNKIEQHCRNFLWGVEVGGRRLNLVKWEEVCRPKEQGGLSIRKLNECNRAFLMKLTWQIMFGWEVFWIRIVKDKYMKESWPAPDMRKARCLTFGMVSASTSLK